MSTTTGTALDEFVELTMRKRDLERQLRAVKEQIEPLAAQLLDEFSSEGVSGKRHEGTGRMVSISRKVWARAADGDKPAACEALKDAGLGDYVQEGFNTNSLSAYFREQWDQYVAQHGTGTDPAVVLPQPLRGRIELTCDTTLTVRA